MVEHDTDDLSMIYADFVSEALDAHAPVTEVREVGEHRYIYSAAYFDGETEVVWRADISIDRHPGYEISPTATFSKCHPNAEYDTLQQWTPLATGRLAGPQDLDSWRSLFTVFSTALGLFDREVTDSEADR